MNQASKAVVTVLGFDCKGIIARVSQVLYQHEINILDIDADAFAHADPGTQKKGRTTKKQRPESGALLALFVW